MASQALISYTADGRGETLPTAKHIIYLPPRRDRHPGGTPPSRLIYRAQSGPHREFTIHAAQSGAVPTHSESPRGRKLDSGYDSRVIGDAMDAAARRHLNNTALGSIKTNESHSGHGWWPAAAAAARGSCWAGRPLPWGAARPLAGAPHRQIPSHSWRPRQLRPPAHLATSGSADRTPCTSDATGRRGVDFQGL